MEFSVYGVFIHSSQLISLVSDVSAFSVDVFCWYCNLKCQHCTSLSYLFGPCLSTTSWGTVGTRTVRSAIQCNVLSTARICVLLNWLAMLCCPFRVKNWTHIFPVVHSEYATILYRPNFIIIMINYNHILVW